MKISEFIWHLRQYQEISGDGEVLIYSADEIPYLAPLTSPTPMTLRPSDYLAQVGMSFDYAPLVLNAALRMELGLIARGFPWWEVKVHGNERGMRFVTYMPLWHRRLTPRHREFKAVVRADDLADPIRAEVALERAVCTVLCDADRANAAAYRRVRNFNDWGV